MSRVVVLCLLLQGCVMNNDSLTRMCSKRTQCLLYPRYEDNSIQDIKVREFGVRIKCKC